ncbi:hypothetical protein M378DRAFT_19385 [Amanita muscaria Koide BX008]|uniref:Uncharacterized protein n=1 Tax=Amanita muscaria (strain Koide BX008) TaxID=946122 RepID=A0A0C2WBH0_AMAMK|nr:hypothetical protein M378DRAFT_19385 [Amanita muscaria Koide BX008]
MAGRIPIVLSCPLTVVPPRARTPTVEDDIKSLHEPRAGTIVKQSEGQPLCCIADQRSR